MEQLPWELMADSVGESPQHFARRKGRSVVRRAGDGRLDRRPCPRGDWTLLFATAAPADQGEDELTRETQWARIRAACEGAGVACARLEDATLESIRRVASRCAEEGRPVRALHLLSHGDWREGVGYGLEAGERLVAPDRLGAFIEHSLPELSLFAMLACNGAARAHRQSGTPAPLGSLAAAARAQGAWVVGRRFLLSAPGASDWTAAFYPDWLRQGGDIERAHNTALEALAQVEDIQLLDWMRLGLFTL